ncbi:MAG: bifunctional glutamate N-acetyltransferase/amino-acid acetyltransferase ArgJ [Desulfobacterota bacterium]|nr:bifunctional glutamate N-acetyltransferase/amino-acid acetyltransferase ArgJ [Thermodesulfobacteriota bacterium]
MRAYDPSQGVPGFAFSAGLAKIKKTQGLDLGLIVASAPCIAAGVFTNNRVKAAPVMLAKNRLRSGKAQAVIVNSGNANACTGARGKQDAATVCKHVAAALNIPEHLVIPASTGVIGYPLPVTNIIKTVPHLVDRISTAAASDVAQAIMTTDTFPKMVALSDTVGGKRFHICGIAKGAGMIMPDMATMLAFIMTDAAPSLHVLRTLLRQHVATTFNAITVDGDTSTNDCCIVLASGATPITISTCSSDAGRAFSHVLHEVMLRLSRMIVQDGEGATKLITIRILHARSTTEAKKAGMAVANSCLVKTAFFGEDFNWGRIMAALGRSGARFDMERVDIRFNAIPAVRNGQAVINAADRIKSELGRKEIEVVIDLKQGKHCSTVMTCDLTYDYVKINASYTT